MRDFESWWVGSSQVCQDCYNISNIEAQAKAQQEAKQCVTCKRTLPAWEGKNFQGKTYCEGCYPRAVDAFKKANSCFKCGKLIEREEDRKKGPNGVLICAACYESMRPKFGMSAPPKGLFCPQCGRRLGEGHVHQAGSVQVCDACFKNVAEFGNCSICGKHLGVLKAIRPDGSTICVECARKEETKRKK